MKNIRLASIAAAICLAPVAQLAHAGWHAPAQITGYYVYDTGSAYFKTTSMPTGTGCADNSYIALDVDAKNFKAIWAQVLSAHAQGITVSVNITGCVGLYPKAIAIAMPNVW